MVLDRVLIRDTDHLAHFTADLGTSLTSSSFADVVLRCGTAAAAVAAPGAKKVSFPTLRVHRAVLASMSDFLAELILPHPLEEDVHITLDETAFEVARRIVEFSYAGEVRIAKQLVTSVCDAAHRLQIKFLKDSFVKVTDKDYAAMKAGKKTLDTIQKEIKGGVVVSPASPFKKPPSPAKGKAGKTAAAGKKGAKSSTSKADSDTDSADSDDEGRTIKVPAGGVVSKRSAPKAKSKAKSETVMFTLTKQVEDNSTKLVSDNGTFLVHFNQKTAENQENRAPPKPVMTKKQTMVIPKSMVISSSVAIPSSVASIQQPLPPSALAKVKKVMIPPMIRKPTVTLPKNSASPPTFTISKSPASSPQRVISLNTFQVQTIRQADGTQIQVLKPPSGTIMKQTMKSTNPTIVRPIVPSREPPKDALAIAMEAIAGRSAPLRIDLPKNPVPMTRIVLPTSPVAVSKIVLPVKPLPVSAISGLKKMAPSPIKAIIAAGAKVGSQSIAILQHHPPGYAPVGRVSPAKAIDVVPASVLTTSRHSVSQPKLGIPSTVPDDFLMTEDSSEGSVNAASNPPTAKGRKVAVVSKAKAVPKAKGAKAVQAKKAEAPKPNDAKEPAKALTKATPAKSSLTKEVLNASLSRISGRVRKVNRKYMEEEGGDDGEKSSTSSNVSKVSDVAEVTKEKRSEAVPEAKGNRKRKISSSESGEERKEDAKKQKTTPAAKKAADSRKRKAEKPALQVSSNIKKSSSKPEISKGSKGKESGKFAKKAAPKKAAQDRSRTVIAKDGEETTVGKRLRTRRALV